MSWKAEYVILIIISTLIDYYAGKQIHKALSQGKKKFFLGISLVGNLGLLFSFKYFNFFSESFRNVLSHYSIQLNPFTLKVLLPIGISFYTFQTISYTIDIYRGKIEPEKHLGIFAVFVSFFPQLVAGPIERAKNLLPQFKIEQKFDFEALFSGSRLILWGFFKKIVIADRLALLIGPVFNNVTNTDTVTLITSIIFFGIQIYCDFSGYSDIAIGSARIMGIKLMENFRRPYYSKSVQEFWRRWHISLSTWFRDYLYIPLGGNKVKVSRIYLNYLIVFLVAGLWHGANWTFVIWGLLHGVYLIISKFTRKIRDSVSSLIGLKKVPQIHNIFKVIITYILINFAWIFFRANSISDAFIIVNKLFGNFYGFHSILLNFIKIKFATYYFNIIFLIFIFLIVLYNRDIEASLNKTSLISKISLILYLISINWFLIYFISLNFNVLTIFLLFITIFAYKYMSKNYGKFNQYLNKNPFSIRYTIFISVTLLILIMYRILNNYTGLPVVLILLFILMLVHFIQEKINLNKNLGIRTSFFRWSLYILLILAILIFGTFDDIPFIYFQF